MWHKSSAQSLVETALILPFLLFICFAIIDMGWYIYGFATIYNAARRGAEEASQLPPWPSSIAEKNDHDGCFHAVYKAVQDNAVMFPDLAATYMSVNYIKPDGTVIDNATEATDAIAARKLGREIEVRINEYPIQPLTPLLLLGKTFSFGGISLTTDPITGNPVMPVSTVTRRTIESMGFSPQLPAGCSQ